MAKTIDSRQPNRTEEKSVIYKLSIYFLFALGIFGLIIWPLARIYIYTAVPLVKYFEAKIGCLPIVQF